MNKTWLRPDEAARELGVTRRTIYHWIHTGQLPAYKPTSHTLLIKRDDLTLFANKKTLKDTRCTIST